ncbi:MAG: nucleoside-diphosphate kinase [Solirubrobacteraceae bacterium]|jgi:nucleoside-diphosphate kinase|nr:nucleoside-diphosphate kinase [Solirubrobacteraceae bacterium]
MEQTLILVKPDAFARSLSGEIIARFERKGLRPVAARVLTMSREMAEAHYAEHVGKPFYAGLANFITSGPLMALVFEGRSAIAAARQLIGDTDPLAASPGSIRADFGLESARNLVHGSDGHASAEREIALFFPELAVDDRPTPLRAVSPV